MKKKVSILLAMVMAVSLLTACNQAAPEGGSSAEPSSAAESTDQSSESEASYDPKAFEGTELTFLRHSAYEADWMTEQCAGFEEQTGIKVTVEQIAFSDLHDKTVVDLSSGAGSYDIFATPDYWLAEYAEGGWLADLNEYINNPLYYDPDYKIEDIPQSLLDCNMVEGKLVGFPWKFNATVMYYRSDLMDAPPSTWADYLDYCKENADKDVKGIGFSMSKTSIGDVYMSILGAYGGQLLDDDNKTCLLDSQEALNALNFMVELNSYGVEGSLSRHWDETAVLLMQGNVATDIMVNTQLSNVTDPEKFNYPEDIMVSALPKEKTRGAFTNTWSFAVSAGSKSPAAAWYFIQYVTGADRIKDLVIATEGGTAPARTSLLEDAELVEKYPLFTAMAETSAEGALAAPKTSSWSSVQEVMATHLQNVLSGSESAEDALNNAKSEIDALL